MNNSLSVCFQVKKYYAILLLALSSLVFNSCTEEPQLWKVDSKHQVASDYFNSHSEFSEFASLVKITGLE